MLGENVAKYFVCSLNLFNIFIFIKRRNILRYILSRLSLFLFQFQHQTSVQMQGVRGGSFFPVSASLRSAIIIILIFIRYSNKLSLTRSSQQMQSARNSLFSIPPPDFKFKPGVSGEKLLWSLLSWDYFDVFLNKLYYFIVTK